MPLDGPGFTVKAVNTGESILVNNANKSEIYVNQLSKYSAQSELDVPIIIDGEAIGVINIESKQNNAFNSVDLQLIETLAMHIATAVHRIRASEEKTKLEAELIEERMRGEQEKELVRLKTLFINSATHEIRTPLASIMGYAELIQDDLEGLSESQRQIFEVIRRNAQRLTRLTDDLIDQQRLEEKRITLNKEKVNVSELLEEVRREFLPILEGKHQTLRVIGIAPALRAELAPTPVGGRVGKPSRPTSTGFLMSMPS